MNNNFINLLKDAFENADHLTIEQIRALLMETQTYFHSLENIVRFGDRKEKEEAIAEALALKEFLDFKERALSPFKESDSLNQEERELVSDMNQILRLSNQVNNKPKIKKIKPTKLS